MQLRGWFGKDADGNEITRSATCLCGRVFAQRQLSARFMEMCEGRGAGAVRAVMRDIPDLFVPINCPSCERRQLRPVVVIGAPAERVRLRDEGRFAENMARLFGAYNRPHDDATVRAFWKALEHALSDEQFEQGVVAAIRNEKRWPTPATIAQIVRPAA